MRRARSGTGNVPLEQLGQSSKDVSELYRQCGASIASGRHLARDVARALIADCANALSRLCPSERAFAARSSGSLTTAALGRPAATRSVPPLVAATRETRFRLLRTS